MCGNFNSTEIEFDEKGKGRFVINEYIGNINNSIQDVMLVDLPINMRRFTCFQGDEMLVSRIDIFLLIDE